MNIRGNVRNEPIANTVSELLVFNPIAREIPDQANPEKTIVNGTNIILKKNIINLIKLIFDC